MDHLNQKAVVAHGDDFWRLALHAVDHAVVSDDDLADVEAVEFGDDGAGFVRSMG